MDARNGKEGSYSGGSEVQDGFSLVFPPVFTYASTLSICWIVSLGKNANVENRIREFLYIDVYSNEKRHDNLKKSNQVCMLQRDGKLQEISYISLRNLSIPNTVNASFCSFPRY